MKPDDSLFRREAARLLATLTRAFGVENLALAEDVVQETLASAFEAWSYDGVPPHYAALLARAAKNRALDVFRRERTARKFAPAVRRLIESEWTLRPALDAMFLPDALKDDELRMMFTSCHPRIGEDVRTKRRGAQVPRASHRGMRPEGALVTRESPKCSSISSPHRCVGSTRTLLRGFNRGPEERRLSPKMPLPSSTKPRSRLDLRRRRVQTRRLPRQACAADWCGARRGTRYELDRGPCNGQKFASASAGPRAHGDTVQHAGR